LDNRTVLAIAALAAPFAYVLMPILVCRIPNLG
jgi:hypothetical protein